MADVYLATDEVLGRVVAIKALSERLVEDRDLQARFLREARIGAKLSGLPNIVTVFDVVVERGRPMIVMDYLGGGTLADKVRAGRVPAAQALTWLEQAGRALDAAHAAGVVHGNLKPANVMFGSDGVVRVTDFGIGPIAGDATLASSGTIPASYGDFAPEQAAGQIPTFESDRYALAVMAFELLTGRRPYQAASFAAEARAHAFAPIPAASDVDPSLPPGIDGALAIGLWKHPARRPQSCAALVASLRRAFANSETATMIVQPPPLPAAPPSRSRPPLGRAAALVALIATIGLAGLISARALTKDDRGMSPTATVTRTTTVAGRSEVRTVTVDSAAPVTESQAPTLSPSTMATSTRPTTTGPSTVQTQSAANLNDRGYRLLQQGEPAAALPLLEQSVAALRGTGSITEAYASYNLALARFSTGNCSGVAELLARSTAIQGQRTEIERLLRDLPRRCRSNSGS
jgi:serine/threonine-protein kinase